MVFAINEDMMTNRTRQKEIREIHKKHRLFYELLGGFVLLIIGIFIGAMFFGGENRDYWMNLFTEGIGVLASIGFTVFIIDRLNAKRDRERQTQDLKDRLVREAGSRSNDIAISAVEQLRAKDWLIIGARVVCFKGRVCVRQICKGRAWLWQICERQT